MINVTKFITFVKENPRTAKDTGADKMVKKYNHQKKRIRALEVALEELRGEWTLSPGYKESIKFDTLQNDQSIMGWSVGKWRRTEKLFNDALEK